MGNAGLNRLWDSSATLNNASECTVLPLPDEVDPVKTEVKTEVESAASTGSLEYK